MSQLNQSELIKIVVMILYNKLAVALDIATLIYWPLRPKQ